MLNVPLLRLLLFVALAEIMSVYQALQAVRMAGTRAFPVLMSLGAVQDLSMHLLYTEAKLGSVHTVCKAWLPRVAMSVEVAVAAASAG
ncbi:UNVERIFIED_CONTAM: hypothetical protein HDU68_006123, partial [Siphonaria sp. JEL0065]